MKIITGILLCTSLVACGKKEDYLEPIQDKVLICITRSSGSGEAIKACNEIYKKD